VPLLAAGGILGVARRSRALGGLLLASWVILAPTSSVVPVAAQPIAENRAYLPAALLALAGWPLWALLCPAATLLRAVPWVTAGAGLLLGSLAMNRLALFAEPEALWRDTVAKVPANPRAWCNVGEIELQAGRWRDAEASFRTALALDPGYQGSAATGLAVTLTRSGRWEEALEYFQLETRLQPGKPAVFDNWGNALTQVGRDAEAEEAFQRALRLDPEHAGALNNLAGVRFRAGRLPEAIQLYQRALAREPSDARVRRNLGVALLVAGRHADVVGLLNVALARPELDPDAALIGSSALLELGRAAEAETVLQACLRLRAAWPEAKLLLGNAKLALGQVAEGIAAYEAALADRPGWDQALAAGQRARERLRGEVPTDAVRSPAPRSDGVSPPAGSAPNR